MGTLSTTVIFLTRLQRVHNEKIIRDGTEGCCDQNGTRWSDDMVQIFM